MLVSKLTQCVFHVQNEEEDSVYVFQWDKVPWGQGKIIAICQSATEAKIICEHFQVRNEVWRKRE